jgi:hypothetical protein
MKRMENPRIAPIVWYREAWEEQDAHDERDADEMRLRRWEERREMPHEDAPEPEDTISHAMWLRREEYGDQDREAA